MSALSLRSTDKAPMPPSTRPMGEGVSREEVERRLFFVAEKMLDGVSRRMLVKLSMDLFGVGQRMAQKYVARAERRLQHQAVRESPLFYLELSKMQRDKLLESVLRHINRPENLEPKLLAELVTAANRVLDSRDRAAVLLFQSRAAEENPPARIQMNVKTLETETRMLRGDDEDEAADATTVAEERRTEECAAESDFDSSDLPDLPAETMTRLFELVKRGCSPEEAAQKVFAEDCAPAKGP